MDEPAAEPSSKRHGAAALQDAIATNRTPLFPQGLGVRQPHAAFVIRHLRRTKVGYQVSG
jgi:hypothetical protein